MLLRLHVLPRRPFFARLASPRKWFVTPELETLYEILALPDGGAKDDGTLNAAALEALHKRGGRRRAVAWWKKNVELCRAKLQLWEQMSVVFSTDNASDLARIRQ